MPKGIYKRRFKPPIERFWPKFEHRENGCWEWMANKNPHGYGAFWDGERIVPAHRWAYEHFRGPIPRGLQIDHLCRNRACVNPAHLEAVTCHENLMRGVSPSAVNSRKDSCPRGHEYTEANTWLRSNGSRQCRKCDSISHRRRYAENQEFREDAKRKAKVRYARRIGLSQDETRGQR